MIQRLLNEQKQAILQAGGYVHPNLKIDVDLERKGNELIAKGPIGRDTVSLIILPELMTNRDNPGNIKEISDALGFEWNDYANSHEINEKLCPLGIYFNDSKKSRLPQIIEGCLVLFGNTIRYKYDCSRYESWES